MTRICPMSGFGGSKCPHLIKCGATCRIQASPDDLPKIEELSRTENTWYHAPHAQAVIARWRGGKFEAYHEFAVMAPAETKLTP
jgi:hypothetical protein